MQVSVQIHEQWLNRPEDLRRVMALLAGLEIAPLAWPRQRPPRRPPSPTTPESGASVRPGPARGDAWEPPVAEEEDPDAPTSGRQLLGWASKQQPDLKGVLIGYGKKRGLHSKIVEWSPREVAEAYRSPAGTR